MLTDRFGRHLLPERRNEERDSMRFQTFASGSSGNCSYIGSETTHLLFDVGISRKRTQEALNRIDLDFPDIDGIFITHEHSDHIQGLAMILKKYDIPVYATAGTIAAIRRMEKYRELSEDRFIPVRADEKTVVKDITVNPMTISHDAAEPVGYRVLYGGKKVSICTDLGCYTDYTKACLKDSDVLLLEANHDVNMLQVGPYPYPLKQRILSDRGHLSNAASGTLLDSILNSHMKAIFLGHLSQENNYPDLAFETVRLEINAADDDYEADELPIRVAPRKEASGMVEI